MRYVAPGASLPRQSGDQPPDSQSRRFAGTRPGTYAALMTTGSEAPVILPGVGANTEPAIPALAKKSRKQRQRPPSSRQKGSPGVIFFIGES